MTIPDNTARKSGEAIEVGRASHDYADLNFLEKRTRIGRREADNSGNVCDGGERTHCGRILEGSCRKRVENVETVTNNGIYESLLEDGLY